MDWKQITPEELKLKLELHLKWLKNEMGGERADLSYADLRSANLSYADLSYADLSYADLRSADLRSADLRYADLSSANLSYADLSYANLSSANLSKTLYEGIDWLAYIGIIPDSKGKARAYKVVKENGQGIQYSGIDYLKNKIVSVTHDDFDTDVNVHCSRGINLATFQWCLNVKTRDTYKLLLMEFDASPDNVCVPLGTDGKFRVKKAKRIGECDWQGRLLKTGKET